MLNRARERARAVSQQGALFPWRTINGEEASSNFQAGTAQYHINADIAYAIRRNASITGDMRLLGDVGAEILAETARLWARPGFYGRDGRFHIHGVTGPDEYTTVVNDNTYTNLMARLNLNFAAATVRRLRQERPEDYTALVHAVKLQPGEVESWERAAAAMHVPFDRGPRHSPAGRHVPGPGGMGPGQHATREIPAAAALSPAGDLPPSGAQAGRHRARDVPARQRVLRGTKAPQLRVLRSADHRRLIPGGLRSKHHRRRDRQPAPGPGVLRVRAAHGPG